MTFCHCLFSKKILFNCNSTIYNHNILFGIKIVFLQMKIKNNKKKGGESYGIITCIQKRKLPAKNY
jgi:hypothetical protein